MFDPLPPALYRLLDRPVVVNADADVPICAGVVGTALSARSTTPTEGSVASSNGMEAASPVSSCVVSAASENSQLDDVNLTVQVWWACC